MQALTLNHRLLLPGGITITARELTDRPSPAHIIDINGKKRFIPALPNHRGIVLADWPMSELNALSHLPTAFARLTKHAAHGLTNTYEQQFYAGLAMVCRQEIERREFTGLGIA